jgi:hypothetical protein
MWRKEKIYMSVCTHKKKKREKEKKEKKREKEKERKIQGNARRI